jgi:hypothetical protein
VADLQRVRHPHVEGQPQQRSGADSYPCASVRWPSRRSEPRKWHSARKNTLVGLNVEQECFSECRALAVERRRFSERLVIHITFKAGGGLQKPLAGG